MLPDAQYLLTLKRPVVIQTGQTLHTTKTIFGNDQEEGEHDIETVSVVAFISDGMPAQPANVVHLKEPTVLGLTKRNLLGMQVLKMPD